MTSEQIERQAARRQWMSRSKGGRHDVDCVVEITLEVPRPADQVEDKDASPETKELNRLRDLTSELNQLRDEMLVKDSFFKKRHSLMVARSRATSQVR